MVLAQLEASLQNTNRSILIFCTKHKDLHIKPYILQLLEKELGKSLEHKHRGKFPEQKPSSLCPKMKS